MNVPVDDNDLETSLRNAFVREREPSFEDWRAKYGDALTQLGRPTMTLTSKWRIQIMKWSVAALTVFVIAGVWMFLRGGSADEVFAQALAQATKANTFSADETMTYTQDGKQERVQQRIMFKQPHLERQEILKDGQITEITITDYGKRRRLSLQPAEKEAWSSDWNNVYEIDPETGNVRLEKLNTSFREELLSLQARAVQDLGEVELSGRKVRLTQSSNEKRVVKVWTDPQTRRPIQVSISRPNQETIISSIKIDEELPDDLFHLDPPQDYKISSDGMRTPRIGQLFAKMKYLLLKCYDYEAQHPKTFPPRLTDLYLKPDVLQNLLTLPGGGRLEYIRPEINGEMSKKVVLHEAYEKWPADGIVAGFGDGHVQRIQKEEDFKQLINGR
jgi:outer membrane lipoprotein-sorting protein